MHTSFMELLVQVSLKQRSIGDGVEVHIKTKPLKGYVEYDKIVNRFQSIDLLQKLLACEAYIFIRVF
ncbi:hypothetical protein E1A91_D10G092900v1 [Gossypium mustelinum]|uniref:Uncharacterized protein n=1 Tax=Gossypium mustelinum TaxID=34275 RepID=A0A5D2T5U5_GOSMU|nr:hypothetical protein E1A91_D10G092900v1 [Gossypium mustelinum]